MLETPRGRRAHALLHAGGHQGHRQGHDARPAARPSGAQIILANTYHLALRPGSDTVRRLGGLHAFMQWDGPILTDSGGYQVFSLRDTAKIDDAGVAFRSIYDGSKHVFTPERAMAEQQALGADFIMCFDQCPPGTATEAEVAEAVRADLALGGALQERPPGARRPGHRRAADAAGHHAGGGRCRGCGGRASSALQEIGFPGYAIGGLTVGEDRSAMLETTVAGRLACCPADRLRYFMGIGDPEGLVEVIGARGGHLRLRASHPDRPHGHGVHACRAAQSAQRRARPLHGAARGGLPLPGLHAASRGGPSGISSCRRRSSGSSCSPSTI